MSYASSSYHLPSWRPHLPNLPSIMSSPLRPSNLTLELENGEREHVPAHLKKTTPNFHLIMSSLKDSPEFCKATMAGVILNYPPPTVVNLFQEFKSQAEQEKARLKSILDHLRKKKSVKNNDLVLIVDGEDTWFQLPSDVIIRQYQNIVDDANKRLREQYGLNGKGLQKYNQTIIFGAEKVCKGTDVACKFAPYSPLPSNIYGQQTGKEIVYKPARYLDSGIIIGPASDMRALFDAAVRKFEAMKGNDATVQSTLSTIFGEQQLARNVELKRSGSVTNQKWFSWFGGRAESSTEEKNTTTLQDGKRYEFSIGLDYTHTIFQPFQHNAPSELVPLTHDNNTNLAAFHHPDTPTPILDIPTALQRARPPFWTPDLSHNDPKPDKNEPAYIEPLQYQQEIDELKPRSTSWLEIELIQNSYTGAIPAIFHLKTPSNKPKKKVTARSPRPRGTLPKVKDANTPIPPITFQTLWYTPYSRALLRRAFRLPQSPLGAHFATVGGDQMWDSRGGRGGVWTEANDLWLPWGEVDGVCGTVKQMDQIFGDKKGVWLHEHEEDGGEGGRRVEEEELERKIQQAKLDAEDRKQQQQQDQAGDNELDEEEREKMAAAKAKADEEKKKVEEEGEEAMKKADALEEERIKNAAAEDAMRKADRIEKEKEEAAKAEAQAETGAEEKKIKKPQTVKPHVEQTETQTEVEAEVEADEKKAKKPQTVKPHVDQTQTQTEATPRLQKGPKAAGKNGRRWVA